MLHCLCTVHRFTSCWIPCGTILLHHGDDQFYLLHTAFLSLLGQRQACYNAHKLQIALFFIRHSVWLSSKCLQSLTILILLSGSGAVGVPVVKGFTLLHSGDDPDMNQDYLFHIYLLVRPRSGLFLMLVFYCSTNIEGIYNSSLRVSTVEFLFCMLYC